MKMKDYTLSKEVAHCGMCSKNTATAEIKFENVIINICNSCLENIKQIF